MKHMSRHIFNLACAALLASAGTALLLGGLTGCKNSTDASTGADAVMGAPPVVPARIGNAKLSSEKPDSAAWARMHWQELVNPGNSLKKTGLSRAAIAYDATHLYVAIVCDKPIAGFDEASVFIDTHGTGKEFIEIKTGSQGPASATWYRSTIALTAREDGAPSFTQPLTTIPECQIRGLTVKTWPEANQWSAVFTIPFKGLPSPMHTTIQTGATVRLNCLRVTQSPTSPNEYLQSNLSKVFQGAQSVSPYRMAEVRLVGE